MHKSRGPLKQKSKSLGNYGYTCFHDTTYPGFHGSRAGLHLFDPPADQQAIGARCIRCQAFDVSGSFSKRKPDRRCTLPRSPLWPRAFLQSFYGGTERVVAWLVNELVTLGHEVTLFASADSSTRANLHPVWPQALQLGRKATDPAAASAALLEAVARRARDARSNLSAGASLARFEERFTAARMAADYARHYQALLSRSVG